MLLFFGLVLGLAAGAAAKGKFLRLSALRGLWFAAAPLALNPIIRFCPQITFWAKAVVITAIYLLIIMFAISNRRYLTASSSIGLGTLSNYIVIAANGFRMPVSAKALAVYTDISAQSVYLKRPDYFIAENGARLLFLGDVIYIPLPFMKSFISAGDIFIAAGVFLLVLTVMKDENAFNAEVNNEKHI